MLVCIVFSMHTIGTVRYLAFRSIVSEVSYYPFEFLTSRSLVSRLWVVDWDRDSLCVVHTYLNNQPIFSKGAKGSEKTCRAIARKERSANGIRRFLARESQRNLCVQIAGAGVTQSL